MLDQPTASYKFPKFLVIDLASGQPLTRPDDDTPPLPVEQRFEFYSRDEHTRIEWAALLAQIPRPCTTELRIKDATGAVEEPACLARLILVDKSIAILEWQPLQASKPFLKQDSDSNNNHDHDLYLHRMATVGGLAAKVAHEINNPIMIIAGNITILEESLASSGLTEECLTAIKKIKSVTMTVRNIIRSLQIAARDGRHDPFVPVTFKELLEGILPLCEDKFSEGGVDLQIAYQDARFECRKVEMIQVISNLLINAFHAAADTRERWVRLEFTADSSEVKIRTIDSGKGIPPELRKQIMRPYFTTKALGRGTGLGLSIASSIVQAHQGSIKIDSEHPNTCFCISFPRNS